MVKINVPKKEIAPSCGMVRIDGEAEQIVKRIQAETGLRTREIVSQIIIQAAENNIEIIWEQ